MVTLHLTWDFVKDIDRKAYGEWAKKAIGATLQSPGLIEFRANRNLCGSPNTLVSVDWESAESWGNFAETIWPALEAEANPYIKNISYILWGASPVVPQPLHPPK